MQKTGLVSDSRYKDHDSGTSHPESPDRYDAVLEGIMALVPHEQLIMIEPRYATEAEIALCHPESYLNTVRNEVSAGLESLSTGDTYICSESFDVALLAAGGCLNAVDSVINGDCRNAFINARPPGHHATTEAGMGFCIFNNIAIAARYAQKKQGISKVLIVDWDIHHGNGTQDIFYDDPSVFYFSTHSWPLYPGTGQAHQTGIEEGKGYTMNCPFPAGSCGSDLAGALKSKLIPAMKSFKPDFVMISAGFDARIGDTVGNFALQDSAFADLTQLCVKIAEEYCDGRLISALEGGYSLSGLSTAAGTHVKTLTEDGGYSARGR